MSNATAPVIYQNQGILSILSRSWNLVRNNLKASLLMVAPPTVMNILFFIFLSMISSQAFLTEATPVHLGIRLLIAILAMLFSIPTLIVSTLCYFTMCRYFYCAIINPKPPAIQECALYLLKKWLPISGLVAGLGLLVTGLVVVNIIVFYLGILLVGAIMGAVGLSVGNSDALLPKLMMIAFVLVLGFVLLAGLIALGSLEVFLFSFPITSLVTEQSDSKKSVWQHLNQSYQLLFRNFPGAVLFSLGLLFFSWILLIVLMSPVYLWILVESTRISLSFQSTLPFYIQTILNLWSSLTNMLITPLIASAMALFWYDCQTRSKGLDLQLWLEKLQGLKPGQAQGNTESGA